MSLVCTQVSEVGLSATCFYGTCEKIPGVVNSIYADSFDCVCSDGAYNDRFFSKLVGCGIPSVRVIVFLSSFSIILELVNIAWLSYNFQEKKRWSRGWKMIVCAILSSIFFASLALVVAVNPRLEGDYRVATVLTLGAVFATLACSHAIVAVLQIVHRFVPAFRNFRNWSIVILVGPCSNLIIGLIVASIFLFAEQTDDFRFNQVLAIFGSFLAASILIIYAISFYLIFTLVQSLRTILKSSKQIHRSSLTNNGGAISSTATPTPFIVTGTVEKRDSATTTTAIEASSNNISSAAGVAVQQQDLIRIEALNKNALLFAIFHSLLCTLIFVDCASFTIFWFMYKTMPGMYLNILLVNIGNLYLGIACGYFAQIK